VLISHNVPVNLAIQLPAPNTLVGAVQAPNIERASVAYTCRCVQAELFDGGVSCKPCPTKSLDSPFVGTSIATGRVVNARRASPKLDERWAHNVLELAAIAYRTAWRCASLPAVP
jgi:hypothetical protein